MGLFDGGAKKEQLAEEITEKMRKSALINTLCLFEEKEEEWIHSIVNYDDNGNRKVIVAPNVFYIYRFGKEFNVNFNTETGDFAEVSKTYIADDLYLRFSSLGFRPLTVRLNEKGREEISLGKMLFLLATTIRERMQNMYPNIEFSEINETCYTQGKEHVSFTYAIPKKPFIEWI